MTATVEQQIPFEQVDTPDTRTPAVEAYRKQRGTQDERRIIPRGTYDATLIETTVVRRKDGGGYVVRMVARTDRLGAYLLAWRGLSTDPTDPYALTDGQVKSLRKFAEGMGITVPAPAPIIVGALHTLVGETVQARVIHTPAGLQSTFTRETAALPPSPSTSLRVAGCVIDIDPNGEVIDERLQGRAAEAHEAHQKIVGGQSAVRAGFQAICEGCHELRESRGWLALGFETLNEYLAQPDVELSKSEFERAADIWQTYVLDGGARPELLAGAAPSKLEVPLPALKQGLVDAERAAADAESMTRKDLREHYRDLMGDEDEAGPPEPPGSHMRKGLPQQALELITERPGITIPEIAAMLEVRQNGLYKVLPELAAEGVIVKDGRGWRPRADDDPERGESPAGGTGDPFSEVVDEAHVHDLKDEVKLLTNSLGEAEQRAEAWKEDSIKRLNEIAELKAQVQNLNERGIGDATSPEVIDAAKGAVRTLRQVLDEIGDPKQKRMGKDLRARVVAALQEADDHGLGEQ
jgi:hypothetical protein